RGRLTGLVSAHLLPGRTRRRCAPVGHPGPIIDDPTSTRGTLSVHLHAGIRVMFGPATLTLLTLLLLISLLARQTPLFLLALALLLAALLSRLYERYCLTGLEYRRRFSRRQVPFGETVDLEIEVVNRKLLPLAWLDVEDEIPRELLPARSKVVGSHKAGR